jgi:hypothetical protein
MHPRLDLYEPAETASEFGEVALEELVEDGGGSGDECWDWNQVEFGTMDNWNSVLKLIQWPFQETWMGYVDNLPCT